MERDGPQEWNGFIAMRFFDLLLCLGLLLLAGFLVRLDINDIREMRRHEAKAATLFEKPVSLRSLNGFSADGHPISMLPLGFKRLAIFVIHGNRLQADLDLWNEAARQNRPADLEFVGVCDDAACIKTVGEEPGKAHFSTVLFGDYYAMRSLLKADARRQIIILDRETGRIRNADYPSLNTSPRY